jgi:hypothetical protein
MKRNLVEISVGYFVLPKHLSRQICHLLANGGSEVSYQNTHQQLHLYWSLYVIFRFILAKVAIAEVTAIIKRISSLVNF